MWLKRRVWSPYISGIVIGLLQVPVLLILGASLGASGIFGPVSCWLLGAGQDSGCFPLLKNWWQLGVVFGIVMGAYLSRHLSKTKRPRIPTYWGKIIHEKSPGPRLMMAFFGGFIFMIGARLADGCTSGNGISGIALLSGGSFIVITSMFVGGILISRIYLKR